VFFSPRSSVHATWFGSLSERGHAPPPGRPPPAPQARWRVRRRRAAQRPGEGEARHRAPALALPAGPDACPRALSEPRPRAHPLGAGGQTPVPCPDRGRPSVLGADNGWRPPPWPGVASGHPPPDVLPARGGVMVLPLSHQRRAGLLLITISSWSKINYDLWGRRQYRAPARPMYGHGVRLVN
jgi:hypothetical protein